MRRVTGRVCGGPTAAGAVAPQAQDQEGDYIFIGILNKSPRPPVSQAPAFMVIGDELPTMPGQVQVVLGPDPKLIFICSCVYNFAHSLPFLFHHYWDQGRGRWGRWDPGVRQRALADPPQPGWHQPLGAERAEAGGKCRAGAKGSLETTKN